MTADKAIVNFKKAIESLGGHIENFKQTENDPTIEFAISGLSALEAARVESMAANFSLSIINYNYFANDLSMNGLERPHHYFIALVDESSRL